MLTNQDVYNLPGLAAEYARQDHLQPPEETVLRLMLPHLPTAHMLDLGVGGGRTTVHFAHLVRQYVGVDYCEGMILECQRRFAGCPAHVSFRVCDARSMDMFQPGSFDFILFSHNGIDSVSHDDRAKILKEIRRVGRPNGWFCFSTHNLNWCANLFDLRRMISLNPKLAMRTAKRLVLRFCCNRHVRAATVRSAPFMVINESFRRHQMQLHYIRPLVQMAQLREDFTGVRVFSQATGLEITDHRVLQNIEDPWLYYLCRFK